MWYCLEKGMARVLKIESDLLQLQEQLSAVDVNMDAVEYTLRNMHWTQYKRRQTKSDLHATDVTHFLNKARHNGYLSNEQLVQLCNTAMDCGWNPLHDFTVWELTNIFFALECSQIMLQSMAERIFDDPKQPTLLAYMCHNYVVKPEVVHFVLQHTPPAVLGSSSTIPLLDIIWDGDCDHFGHLIGIAQTTEMLWEAGVRPHKERFFARAKERMGHDSWDSTDQDAYAHHFLQQLEQWQAVEQRERIVDELDAPQQMSKTRKM